MVPSPGDTQIEVATQIGVGAAPGCLNSKYSTKKDPSTMAPSTDIILQNIYLASTLYTDHSSGARDAHTHT